MIFWKYSGNRTSIDWSIGGRRGCSWEGQWSRLMVTLRAAINVDLYGDDDDNCDDDGNEDPNVWEAGD